MVQRKQRINVALYPDTLVELEKQVPAQQRSDFIDHLLRERFGLPEAEPKQKGFHAYRRPFPATGSDKKPLVCTQYVYAYDGRIECQGLMCMHIELRSPLHFDTKEGNPEWVGRRVNVIYSKGFERIRGIELGAHEKAWQEWKHDEELEQYRQRYGTSEQARKAGDTLAEAWLQVVEDEELRKAYEEARRQFSKRW